MLEYNKNICDEITKQSIIYAEQIKLIFDLYMIGSQRNFNGIAWENLLIQKQEELEFKLKNCLKEEKLLLDL